MLWVPAAPQPCQSVSCLCSSPSAVLPAVGWCRNPHYCQLQGRHISSSHPDLSSITCMVVAEKDGGLDEPHYNLFASAGSLCYQFMSYSFQGCMLTSFFLLLLLFFQAVQLLPIICWGSSFPPTLQLGCCDPAAKTPSFFSSSPKHGWLSPYTHTFSPQTDPGSVRAGHNGGCCRLGWKRETLKTKSGRPLKLRLQGLVLSPTDLVCM